MNFKPWTLAGICLLVLLLGALLGRLLAHNTIIVDVEDGTNKINLSPAKNDVIRWTDQANHKVKVRFVTDAPCEEIKTPSNTTDTCTINIEHGNFQYLCDGSSTCVDPGVDPRSTSSDLESAPGGLVAPKAGNSVVASISCPAPNGTPVITWSPDPPGSSVTVGENIVWKAGSLDFTVSGFTYQNNPIQLCSQSTINQAPGHHTCTVQDGGHTPPYTVTYTVTTSGPKACGSTSPTLTVYPATDTSTPAPKG